MKRIVLMVEGEGDVESAPVVTSKVISAIEGWGSVSVDENPIRVGDITKLAKGNYFAWPRKLGVCLKRKNLGGVLLLLDGDIKKVNGTTFCPVTIARELVSRATAVGAGELFSLGVTFARQEFESWGIASCDSLSGLKFDDGLEMRQNLIPPNGDIEAAPRDAKKWISQNMVSGSYSETRHQSQIARALDFDEIRKRNIRSFIRFENSVKQVVNAITSGQPIATPVAQVNS